MLPFCTTQSSDTTREQGSPSMPEILLTLSFQISRSYVFAEYAHCTHIRYRLGLAFPNCLVHATTKIAGPTLGVTLISTYLSAEHERL